MLFGSGSVENAIPRRAQLAFAACVVDLGEVRSDADGRFEIEFTEEAWQPVLPMPFDPVADHDVSLLDAGGAWAPLPWLRLKVDYRVSTRQTDAVTRGLSSSFSIVF